MKNYKILFILCLIAFISTSIYAQIEVKRSNNKVNLNGKPYYIHIVRKGETLFAISQAYNVAQDTIKKDNLHVSDTINVNQFLKIRINDEKSINNIEFVFHNVIKGDTPYNLSLRYNVSVDDIYKYNPDSRLGIFIGEVIKIPVEKAIMRADTIIEKKAPNFLYHVADKKQTIYGLASKYFITQEDIESYNPDLKERPLAEDEIVKIPITEETKQKTNDYFFHLVNAKETAYGLQKTYDIKERVFLKLNPILHERSLQVGEYILIPKSELTDSISNSFIKKDSIYEKPKKDIYAYWQDSLIIPGCDKIDYDTINSYKVAFFMPFYLNVNDTLGKFINTSNIDKDGVEIIETKPRTGKIEDEIFSHSKMFVDFYQGALLAIKELKKQGLSFEIHVFDTQKDSAYTVELLKTNPDLKNFDLFIGPVYGEILDVVGDFAWENQINIVSPLSLKSGFIDHNPYAFQVSPPFEVQMYHASDFLNNFDTKNYIVIHDGNNLDQDYISLFKKQLYAQMNDENFNQIKYNEVFYYDAQDSVLKQVFTKDIENIVIIPSNNQAFVTDVIGKLNGYSYEYEITTFGQPRWIRFENIDLDNFHNTKTHIFSNSFIDYKEQKVIDFVKDYRINFNGEPDKFGFQGYDITKYFLLALNKYGPDFRKCIHMHNVDLLQTKLNFVPYTDQGGYQNTAIYILEFSKDFKLNKIASYPN